MPNIPMDAQKMKGWMEFTHRQKFCTLYILVRQPNKGGQSAGSEIPAATRIMLAMQWSALIHVYAEIASPTRLITLTYTDWSTNRGAPGVKAALALLMMKETNCKATEKTTIKTRDVTKALFCSGVLRVTGFVGIWDGSWAQRTPRGLLCRCQLQARRLRKGADRICPGFSPTRCRVCWTSFKMIPSNAKSMWVAIAPPIPEPANPASVCNMR